MKRLITLFISLFPATIYAQLPPPPAASSQSSVNWKVPVGYAKTFIENKSQFDGRNELPSSHVLYAVDWGATQIYFTKNGLTYRFDEFKFSDESEREREARIIKDGKNHPKEEDEVEVESEFIHMQWLYANTSARVLGEELADDYFSYAVGDKEDLKNINNIRGYHKLLYKNLYPNIDVEYSFHQVEGIKYNIILHPGADISQVKMKYSVDEDIRADASGNVLIETEFGDIVDHAPVTFYAAKTKKVLPSRYIISANTISFQVEDYNKNKTVIIDPWTVTPSMPTANKVYYIKADSSGNAYIYGGDSPHRLQKLTAGGALVWTYNTTYTSQDWFGALAVDLAGNSYITSATGILSKVNTSGGLVWSRASGGAFSLTEFWAPVFNCDYSQLVIGGTYSPNPTAFVFNGAIYEMDLSNGAIANTIITTGTLVGAPNTPPFIANEVRSMTYSPNGNYYFLTLDTIGMITPSLSIGYRERSSYNLSYYLPYGTGGGQGINGMGATPHLLYTTDGQVLHRRDINNGAIINTVFIPSGSVELCSGIAVDSCENVYVGAIGKVHKYDSNLNLVATANAPGEVYGIAVNSNGEVLASGHDFIMSINMSSCPPMTPVCRTIFNVTMSQTNALCNGGCDGSATAVPSNGNAPYTYFWSNGQTSSTATNLCAGSYVVTVTDASNIYVISSVSISQPPVLSVALSSSVTTCGTTALATPSSGISPFAYTWSNGATTASISSLTTGAYSVTVFDGNNCSATGSINVTQSPGLIASATSTSPACGACDGTATATPFGGNPPFSYTWSNGDTSQTISALCAGIYNVTISETTTAGNVVFWNENFTNGGIGWSLKNSGPGANGSAPNRWVVNNNVASCSQCPAIGSGGNYLHVTCDSTSFFCAPMGGPSCVYSPGFPVIYDNTTDKYAASPNISTIGKTGITFSFWYMSVGDSGRDYGLVRLSNDGGASWTDLPTKYSGVVFCTQAIINIPASYENIPNFRIGFRWINDNDLNGNDPPFLIDDIELSAPVEPCTGVAPVILNSAAGALVSIDSVKDVSCKNANDGAVQLTVSGGNPPYGYSWSSGDSTEDISGLNGGTYFVSVTDTSDCITIVPVTVNEPSPIFITGILTNAGCAIGGAINISIAGGTPPYHYSWTTGDTTEDLSNIQGGSYGFTVTDFNNCTKNTIFTVSSPGIFLDISATDASCGGATDGSVITSVLGGVPPFHYFWSNGDTSISLLSIPADTYSITVTDNSGCSATQSAIVDAPPIITFTASITRVLCESGNNGGIKLIPYGGTSPYTAVWSNGDTSLSISNLEPDIYLVTVTDADGCTQDTSIALDAFSAFQVNAVGNDATCEGATNGSAIANIISGNAPPYSYSWSTGSTTTSIENLSAGIYSVTIIDSLNCPKSDTVIIGTEGGLIIDEEIDNASCPFRTDGSIATTVSGGITPYYYLWNNGNTTSALLNIASGSYSVIVTDFNNCAGADTIFVPFDSTTADCDTVIIYDVFSPNGDASNDLWIVDGLVNYPNNEIQIFNRWGNVVFEAKPYNNDWDGHSKKDQPLPTATYYYILKLNDPDETIYSGDVTLIR